jgi:hypothetical protein
MSVFVPTGEGAYLDKNASPARFAISSLGAAGDVLRFANGDNPLNVAFGDFSVTAGSSDTLIRNHTVELIGIPFGATHVAWYQASQSDVGPTATLGYVR